MFGYTIINDVSARDYQLRTTQWLMGKTFDTFCPMGPWIVTADEIEDPHNLDIKMTINGEVLQNSNTRELIFGIPDLIAYLSSVMTLESGESCPQAHPPVSDSVTSRPAGSSPEMNVWSVFPESANSVILWSRKHNTQPMRAAHPRSAHICAGDSNRGNSAIGY